ncbi:Elongation factor P--(R)-beta-lysine ligase [Pirellulimonas nuda]|uniref:Elongation factor P--(R)-beta-lysine ligase n=1 Tax=Pirellulimonas nuda TaxID=2528009 RepID=A0A518D6U7_9BACT|nr:EF-P lysine aminoacylase EpmA [Pirellulimonas nuda]QDU87176.1 Elongation factor P--(R)-beta-lysine ligase [Pirellulimonas nuda]
MNRLDRLRMRAQMLSRLRAFFAQHGFLEVETPALSAEVIPELHIEPWRASQAPRSLRPRVGGSAGCSDHDDPSLRYLQASPELHMKRLLCEGSGPIIQVARAYRADEQGPLHNAEFTMVEWYRPGDGMAEGIALLDALVQRVAGAPAAVRTSYREAFVRHQGLDPFTATQSELSSACESLGVDLSRDVAAGGDRDGLLNIILALGVEPHLGRDAPEALYHYPGSQASLARTTTDPHGAAVAERFELYWRGVELANGYHELCDAEELRRRLERVNHGRVELGHAALPLPEALLGAMAHPGLPASTGVALGFDRLVMLAAGAESIDQVMTYRD